MANAGFNIQGPPAPSPYRLKPISIRWNFLSCAKIGCSKGLAKFLNEEHTPFTIPRNWFRFRHFKIPKFQGAALHFSASVSAPFNLHRITSLHHQSISIIINPYQSHLRLMSSNQAKKKVPWHSADLLKPGSLSQTSPAALPRTLSAKVSGVERPKMTRLRSNQCYGCYIDLNDDIWYNQRPAHNHIERVHPLLK